ncbi:MAG: protein-L-isoaspartate(D-aspartate) O-methyltransferase [Bacteroides sp.]|nr:protein-L-isoaspartate(D-aspartate) O-methyltransferase [Ruminococcus flavefaciens]MCM1554912.1 protein-L-isoaspartate(D-aspartate) O-methyltransferase [Bacteroides sp.]
MQQDTFRHKGMRQRLVDELRRKGADDQAVLDAIGAVPRHCFLDSVFDARAYQDIAIPIGEGQTISRPLTVASQSSLLEVFPGARILEVGTGSGYQSMILDKLGAEVYTIERQRNLYIKTKALFEAFKSRIHCFYGDGYKGLPQFAPFDRILVTCGAAEFPNELLAQLSVGGIMVIPLGSPNQIMTKVVRTSETETEISEHGDFTFVPMLSQKSE